MAITVTELEAKLLGNTAHAEAALSKFGASTQRLGQSMTTNLTLPIVGIGAAVTTLAFQYDDTLTQIDALTSASSAQVAQWGEDIRALAPTLGKSPRELASALYFVASAGFEGAEAMEVMAVAAKASAVGLGETQVIASVLGSAINAYGAENLTAARATDILIQAVSEGTAEAPEFAASLGNVIGSAAQIGATFEDVTGSIAAMTTVGIGAAEATTSLNQVFSTLMAPSTEAKEALDSYGLSAAGLRTMIGEQGLMPTLGLLAEKFDGNAEATTAVFGNIRALRGVLALTGGDAERVGAIFDSVTNSTGALDTAFQTTSESAGFKFRQSMAELEEVGLNLGAAVLPLVVSVLGRLSDAAGTLSRWWSTLGPDTQTLVVQIAGLVAAAGPAILIFGKLVSGVALLMNPIGLAITAVGLLGAAFATNFMGIRDAVQPVVEWVTDVLGDLSNFISMLFDDTSQIGDFKDQFGGIGEIVASVVDTISSLMPTITGAIETMGEMAQRIFVGMIIPAVETVSEVWESAFRTVIGPAIEWFTSDVLPVLMQWIGSFADFVQGVMPLVTAAFGTVLTIGKFMVDGLIVAFGLMLSAVQNVWPAIQVVIETVVGVIGGIITTFLAILSGNWGAAWEAIKGIFVTIWNGIVAFIGTIPALILGILQGLAGAIMVWGSGLLGRLLGWAGGLVGSLVGKIATLSGGWMGAIAGIPGRLATWFGGLISSATTAAGTFVGNIVRAILKLPGNAIDAIAPFVGKVQTFFRELPGKVMSSLIGAGGAIVTGLWRGITGLAGWLWDKVSGFIGGIVNGVLDFLGIGSPSKVFAEIGANMMLGLGNGIDGATRGVANTMNAAIGEIVPSSGMQLGLDGTLGAVAPTGAGIGAAAAGGGVSVVLYADRYMGTMDEARHYSDLVAKQIRMQRST